MEDVTHVKAKDKDDSLKFKEVQDAMNSSVLGRKDEWMTPDLFSKIA